MPRAAPKAVFLVCAFTAVAALSDVAEILTSISSLYSQNLLTEDEFAAAKARALGSHPDGLADIPDSLVPVTNRTMTGGVVVGALGGLFALDSFVRISTLTASQKLTWVAAGALPCAVFALAVLSPVEQITSVRVYSEAVSDWAIAIHRQPIDAALHASGQWSMRCLIACLCVTPLKNATKKWWLHPLRQTFGLLAFTYAAIHAVVYSLDSLEISSIDSKLAAIAVFERLQADLQRRPYVLFGLVAGLMMLLLAVTSYNAIRLAMGKWWGRLHKLNYVLSIAAGLHIWQYQAMRPSLSILGANAYPLCIAALLAYRVLPKSQANTHWWDPFRIEHHSVGLISYLFYHAVIISALWFGFIVQTGMASVQRLDGKLRLVWL